ncbi:MAG: hypothetical protein NC489_29045 [Ruminococcus flavefaciens]|nr:hypothetical protein [Ruminococcus flavefaciens]
MKKIITAITVTAMSLCLSLNAHAAELLDKDCIEAEIWEDVWLGKGDNGTDFPEASYKHHLLDEWLDDNYGSDEYDWSELGELKYQYKDYYSNLTENWDFNDDDNGSWTIETEDNSYRFELLNGSWNMINKNGDTVDMFPPFSTEESENPQFNSNSPNNDGNDTNRVIGQVAERRSTASESSSDAEDNLTIMSEESRTEPSKSLTMPIVISSVVLVIIGMVFLVIRKKKK